MGNRLGRALDRTRPLHAAAPDLGEDEEAIVQSRAVALLLEGEGVVARAPLKTRETRLLAAVDAPEERLVGLVQPGQHILQDMRVDGLILGERSTDVLAFCFLLVPRDGDTTPLGGDDALLSRRVVQVAATPHHSVKRPLLGRRGRQFLLVGLAYRGLAHVSLFCLADSYPVMPWAQASTRLTTAAAAPWLAAGYSPFLSAPPCLMYPETPLLPHTTTRPSQDK